MAFTHSTGCSFRFRAGGLLFGDTLQFVRSVGWTTSRSALRRTPLLGFIDVPSASHACCVHLSTDTPKRIRVPGSARPGVFRPCRSSRLRRFPPQRASLQAGRSLALRRFVAPCSRPWGSPCFEPSLGPAQRDPKITLNGSKMRAFPDGVHPSKRSPPRQPGDRHRGPPRGGLRSPIVVPSRRWHRALPLCRHSVPASFLDLKALLHRRVRSTFETLPSEGARCFPGLWANTMLLHLTAQASRIRIHVKEHVRRLPSR